MATCTPQRDTADTVRKGEREKVIVCNGRIAEVEVNLQLTIDRFDTLVITEAENEDFVAAKKTVRRALSLARQTGNQRVIGMLLRQLDLYEQRRKPSEGFR